MRNISIYRHARGVARFLRDGRLECFKLMLSFVERKHGLEIGGPTGMFGDVYGPIPIYARVGSLDNCDLARTTAWTTHSDAYAFSPRKAPGINIFSEGSSLTGIADQSYDFIVSAHNLEHFANPIKALLEWKRIVRPGGGLILVLPDYSRSFDRRRIPTAVDHMFEDFDRDTQEDDVTHLPDVLQNHDLSLDPEAGSFEQFRDRSLNNFANRCLHHHVFDTNNSRELLTRTGMEVLAVELTRPWNIVLLARMP